MDLTLNMACMRLGQNDTKDGEISLSPTAGIFSPCLPNRYHVKHRQ